MVKAEAPIHTEKSIRRGVEAVMDKEVAERNSDRILANTKKPTRRYVLVCCCSFC